MEITVPHDKDHFATREQRSPSAAADLIALKGVEGGIARRLSGDSDQARAAELPGGELPDSPYGDPGAFCHLPHAGFPCCAMVD